MVVVGGGIAGISAAVALAERGVRVTLLEAGPRLGGRVAAWPVEVPGGEPPTQGAPHDTMSRGFHAFFRQYYNLRALLRRVDPDLSGLRAIDDYPLLHGDGSRDSFASIPRQPPLNILGFVAKSPSFGLTDLARVDLDRALGLLDVDFPRTFVEYDGVSAQDLLDAVRFPPGMRHLALEVFARSFFADPREFSAGELVGMFHTYFLGSAEGLLFDVSADDFDSRWWAPLGAYLYRLGARMHVGMRVRGIDRVEGRLRVSTDGADLAAELQDVDAVVLAPDRAGLQKIVAASPDLGDEAWRAAVESQRIAPRFIVQRLWFDTPTRPGTPPFLGTAALGYLDNVSAVHLFEDGAAQWAVRNGGSVVELHAYAVPDDVDDATVTRDMRGHLDRLHPELVDAGVVHEEVIVARDCPLVGTDPWAARPGVVTPDPDVVLAGDGIRCELPVALMERAATTGFQAANHLLAGWGAAGHDLWSAPTHTRFPRATSALRAAVRTLPTRGRTGARTGEGASS
ncbi:FAD-dependent oxidoreductase [Mobilicoccus massiliensis]|uniref:FAD-dependent oxidoreductase n=1 Tax=Mobilicoccus massiliensis TaxID=1522310 RepID=UPI000AAE6A68|nr:FAD-dependent oxidoreductase [Mobilicoccus massiliensis]